MASIRHPNLTLLTSATPTIRSHRTATVIRCGPRDTRGPIMKGRILSNEAIQAIQALKRANRTDPANLPTQILSRLIKSDLTAAFTELLRQDQCALAARVFSTIQSEYSADLDLHANLVQALARNGLMDEIDELVAGMKESGIEYGESRGLLTLVKALIAAERRESVVRVYGLMKKGGYEMEEYLGRVLSKGLRRLGEGELADEVDREYARLYKGIFAKPRVVNR